ncbi:hypothetical protein QEJ31_14070 [Pigmentibacter sp. JX0631]|uniref:hypothetical protein n=1 Tax=Pigmentibacter sp. JX0631 TaxID=2976982 RepID=UPI002468C759|nr:hypothetical protein [Pigmentibacter sp. JX0631]WGL59654.1 hypothetical protein QEJ31_14070 [Pigmentibacter sp. JX0631]
MSQIFRIATTQAIREIIQESAVEGRFGLLLTDESIEKISERVVDLFEMTLKLRAKTQELFGQVNSKTEPASISSKQQKNALNVDEKSPFPRSKNAAEVYDFGKRTKSDFESIPLSTIQDVKLPRTRFQLSLEEKEKLRR